MRHIAKRTPPPATVTEVGCADTTNLETLASARAAYGQVDKVAVRDQLAKEQGWLCAFCMRTIDPENRDKATGEPTMKIAHRVPMSVDPTRTLMWKNLLGSCDGGQRSGGHHRTCDFAQEDARLTVDPTEATSVAKISYQRDDPSEASEAARESKPKSGLFITSADASDRKNLIEVLNLNGGDLPKTRETVWKAFIDEHHDAHPTEYGNAARREYFKIWLAKRGPRLPELLGVIEWKLR